MSACLLSLSVMSLLLPVCIQPQISCSQLISQTAFHASFNTENQTSGQAEGAVLKVSRGTSVVSWFSLHQIPGVNQADFTSCLWNVSHVPAQVPRVYVREHATAYYR